MVLSDIPSPAAPPTLSPRASEGFESAEARSAKVESGFVKAGTGFVKAGPKAPPPEPKPNQSKTTLYDSLEQEMASLLGRQNKT